MVAVHQFLSSLAPRDAQSQHHLQIRDALRGAGYASDIFVGEAKGSLRSHARPFRSFEGAPDTWLLYGHAIGSPVAEFVTARPEPLIVDYHNVTPSGFFAAWEPHAAIRMAAGRRQLRALAARCRLGLADSAYNERELVELGARRTAVVPIMVDSENFAAVADPALLARLCADRASGIVHLLFVGRLAPNKCQHDLVATVAALRTGHGIDARLHLVGGSSSDRYARALRSYARAAGVEPFIEFVGSAPPAILSAYYEGASCFVCLSEHEGFCVPLLESWYHGLPIVAFASTAVTETLDDAGIVLTRKSPATVAAAIARVALDDAPLRSRIVSRGAARLEEFSLPRTRAKLLAEIASVVAA